MGAAPRWGPLNPKRPPGAAGAELRAVARQLRAGAHAVLRLRQPRQVGGRGRRLVFGFGELLGPEVGLLKMTEAFSSQSCQSAVK